MNKRVDYYKCGTERELQKIFASRFQVVSGFSVATGKMMSYYKVTNS